MIDSVSTEINRSMCLAPFFVIMAVALFITQIPCNNCVLWPFTARCNIESEVFRSSRLIICVGGFLFSNRVWPHPHRTLWQMNVLCWRHYMFRGVDEWASFGYEKVWLSPLAHDDTLSGFLMGKKRRYIVLSESDKMRRWRHLVADEWNLC